MPRLRNFILACHLGAALALPACGASPPSAIGRSAVTVAKESRAESGRSYTLGPQFAGQLNDLLIRETEALGGGREGVPLELNRQVLLNINRFLNEDRGFLVRGLGRGSRYIPLMQEIFRQKGLPEDLVYLALIESGFNNVAVSRAAAVGPWQFIAPTARRYGLTIDEWVDERRDPVKSTHAAADYLIALHDAFGSWPMAIAAYNSGEGKIIKGVRAYGVSNFWDMSNAGDHLADETKLYVPSFLAAVIIAKDPAAYGLTIEKQPPDQWEEVNLPQAVKLEQAAQFARSSVERLQELNPHLKKAATPPQTPDFILRLPAGSRKDFIAAYQRAGLGQARADQSPPPSPRPGGLDMAARWRPELEAVSSAAPLETPQRPRPPQAQAAKPEPLVHRVVSGDTLGGLARKYKLTVKALKDLNQLKSDRLTLGQKLLVGHKNAAAVQPTAVQPAVVQPAAQPAVVQPTAVQPAARPAPRPAKASPVPASRPAVHVVAAGETLGGLALKYGLTVKELMALNDLSGAAIRSGQKLKIAAPAPRTSATAPRTSAPAPRTSATAPRTGATPPPATAADSVRVASGDTLYALARRHNLSVDQLKKLNSLTGDGLRPGQVLKIR